MNFTKTLVLFGLVAIVASLCLAVQESEAQLAGLLIAKPLLIKALPLKAAAFKAKVLKATTSRPRLVKVVRVEQPVVVQRPVYYAPRPVVAVSAAKEPIVEQHEVHDVKEATFAVKGQFASKH